MKAIFCNQRNGEHRKALCPGAPQDPAQYQQPQAQKYKLNVKILKKRTLFSYEAADELITNEDDNSKIDFSF